MENTTAPLTYIEATVDYEGKPYLQMSIPFDYHNEPCTKCEFNRAHINCEEVEDVLRTARESKWPCIDNIRRREFVFIKPTNYDEFIAHMVSLRMEK
jgi:hypothetical protein